MSKELSLWFVPLGDAREQLAHLILQLSQKYSSPLFPPHITLLGGLSGADQEIIDTSRQLAAHLPPFKARLAEVDYLDEYHKALFARVLETEPLLAANRAAREMFHRQDDPKFMPHLSLLYGDFAPAVKQDMIASIGKRIDIKFRVTLLELHSTYGDTRDWYSLGQFELGRVREPQE